MRKIREILRLHHEGFSTRKIAQSVAASHSTVMDILRRTAAAGFGWPLPEGVDDFALEAALYKPQRSHNVKPLPDMDWVHRELRRKGVTLQLLWLEYKRAHPDGLQYSQFCLHYKRWLEGLEAVMRQHYPAGERAFVDFAGMTIPVVNQKTGEVWQAQVFVFVLAASNYTYAEAFPSQELPFWLLGHVHAFAFIGGVPEIVVPDNLKAGVTRSCRYEPDLNRSYLELATHYGVAVIPARPRKPRDKAKAESAVQVVERHVLASLRDRTFFSLAEVNRALWEELEKLNEKPFQKLEGSRISLFESLEKPALKPLPPTEYEFAEWRKARVNIDYHVEVEKNFYSVPYQLIKQEVDVRLTATTVEILHGGRRVASHERDYHRGRFHTHPGHRPPAHRRYLEWTPERIVAWAARTGPNTARLVEAIIAAKPHPEQGYRAALGLLRLGDRYTPQRLEAAAARALAIGAHSYRSVKSILERGLDRVELEPAPPPPLVHENLRGPEYYARGEGSSC
ncbi:MAG: IS21 family transposase [Firmicutes bacterium]|nr:IS21 family transposase [Bacillota bacterium]